MTVEVETVQRHSSLRWAQNRNLEKWLLLIVGRRCHLRKEWNRKRGRSVSNNHKRSSSGGIGQQSKQSTLPRISCLQCYKTSARERHLCLLRPMEMLSSPNDVSSPPKMGSNNVSSATICPRKALRAPVPYLQQSCGLTSQQGQNGQWLWVLNHKEAIPAICGQMGSNVVFSARLYPQHPLGAGWATTWVR